ncbi:MAG: beta-glucosidase [Phycisphaerae bacterium]|nr:beta-glucosidase [Phycisphaerae bacterium]
MQTRSINLRVDELLARMTLEEKVGQMTQVGVLQDEHVEMVRSGAIGSSIVASSAWAGHEDQPDVVVDRLNEWQRLAVQESRLGIPLLMARDVIHGFRTIFPIPLGQAATWSPELVERGAAVAAREAAGVGIHWTFAPMVDIARDPRWGRIAEGYGEDPVLASAMAAAAVRGFQGDDPAAPDRLMACAKHFAAYGASEGGRDYDTVDVSERTLRDVHLPSFRAAVRAGVGTLMSAFHEIGGVPVTANSHLLTGILRREWGFDGLVISDWNAVAELIDHGVARDRRDAARLAVLAGVDVDMCSGCYRDHLAELVRSNDVPAATVDDSVRRILRTKFRLGLFEQPFTDNHRSRTILHCAEHVAAARETAAAGIVLLRNEGGLLPLGKRCSRLVIAGPLAQARRELFGTWTLNGVESDVAAIADCVRQTAPRGMTVTAVGGLVDEICSAARKSDMVVLVVGEHPNRSGEAHSVDQLGLPPGQGELVRTLAALCKPLILVVVSGRPLALTWEAEHVPAILWTFHPGGEGGPAVADALFGRINPSGRLPVTMPRSVGQIPLYYSRKNTGRPPATCRFRSHYIEGSYRPLFPFGFGLSYTRFEYSDLELSAATMSADGQVCVAARVTNVGDRSGDEVVQLYVRDLVGSVTRPVAELKSFRRIRLEPGEGRRVEFVLRPEHLAFWRLDGTWGAEAGEFTVRIGPNAVEGLEGRFTLDNAVAQAE